MTTKIVILALCTLSLLALAVLAIVGKLDRLYTMFYPVDSLAPDRLNRRIKRWRILFATDIILAVVLLFVFILIGTLDYYEWALVVVALLYFALEELWVRRA
ncbi:MAG: hypothetical protein J6U49_03340 [Alistipes sp.]|nr:hypothetical protein [Alistipes sp.]